MKNRNFRRPTAARKQKGLTLIEALVWFALLVIVVAGGAAQISKSFGGSDIAKEASAINTLIANTKTIRGLGGYGANGTDLMPSLIARDGIPKSMSVVNDVPVNAWGGQYSVTSTGAGFTISAPSFPRAACIELATNVSRGGAVTTTVGSGAAVTGEITDAVATAQCTSATDNTLSFTGLN